MKKKLFYSFGLALISISFLAGCDSDTNGQSSSVTSIINSNNGTTTETTTQPHVREEITKESFVKMSNDCMLLNYDYFSMNFIEYKDSVSDDNIVRTINKVKSGNWIHMDEVSTVYGDVEEYNVYQEINNDKKEVIYYYCDMEENSIKEVYSVSFDSYYNLGDSQEFNEELYDSLSYNEEDDTYFVREFKSQVSQSSPRYYVSDIDLKIQNNRITYYKDSTYSTGDYDVYVTIRNINYEKVDIVIPKCITDYKNDNN